MAGSFRGQERDRRRELVGASHASQRNRRRQVAHHFLRAAMFPLGAAFGQLGDALRGDEPGTDHVHRDPRGRHFVRQGLGEAQDAGARRGGQDEAGERLFGGDGGEANHPSPLELPHDRHGGAGQVHGGEQVQLDGAVKRVPSLLAERRRRRRSEEHTSELQSQSNLVCRLLLEKKKVQSGSVTLTIIEPASTTTHYTSADYDATMGMLTANYRIPLTTGAGTYLPRLRAASFNYG